MISNFKTNSTLETKELGKKLAEKYHQGGVLALSGELGAGKTVFVQGFAEGLGIKGRLISPTFVLMRQYEIPGNKEGKLFHLDLYRLDESSQIEGLGINEILENPKNIVLIEWAEKLGNNLPQNAVRITIKQVTEESREIQIED